MKKIIYALAISMTSVLTGCIETGYSYNICNNENRHWIDNLSEGQYALMKDNQTMQEYFVTKGPTEGVYLFTIFNGKPTDNFNYASSAQTCNINGQVYIELLFAEAPALGLIKLTTLNVTNWKLEILEPNLQAIARFGIPLQDRPNPRMGEPEKYIYNLDQSVIYGKWKLALYMFDVSTKEENGNLSLSKILKR